MPALVRGRRRGEEGASALELAFLAPGLLFLIFFTIQGALYFYGRNVAIQSAREGVAQLRLAQDQGTYDAISGEATRNAEKFADQIGNGALTGTVGEPHLIEGGERVSMRITGNVISLVPFLDLQVHETAYGPVEKFRGDEGP